MRSLILMRHAKTEPGSLKTKDFDRELIPKGEKDAEKIAHYLKKHFEPIDHIYASSAKRTSATAAIVKSGAGGKLDLIDELYHADARAILQFIKTMDDKNKVVMIVGHNPAISVLSGLLAKDDLELKPSDIVILKLKNISWAETPVVEGAFHKSVY